MKPSHYPFLALILTSNLLMAQSYLSQDEISLFGMRLMDNALDHITLDELNSKFEYSESDELFYRVLVTSKKNANFRRIFLVVLLSQFGKLVVAQKAWETLLLHAPLLIVQSLGKKQDHAYRA